MNTLLVIKESKDAEKFAAKMQLIDPAGTHTAVCDPDQVTEIVSNKTGSLDMIFMDMDIEYRDNSGESGGIAFARSIDRIAPGQNIVFITYPYSSSGADAIYTDTAPANAVSTVSEQANLSERTNDRLYVQCFGNFEVFRGGKPIRFSRSLSKEALAYLVDRRGAACSVSEICGMLWEDRIINTGLKSQCRVVLAGLKKDLADAGAEDIIIKGWNTWSIDKSKVSCDYYDYLESNSLHSFRGEYMTQYSWAETTLGALIQEKEVRIKGTTR